jgi:hypothetical protein
MNRYQVRFIKEVTDSDAAHLVVEVEALNHDEALRVARQNIGSQEWLASYDFHSVEVERFQYL